MGGGFLIAAGLVTPLETALLAAVMTVTTLVVHLHRDIWAAAGGFEFPFLMPTSPPNCRDPKPRWARPKLRPSGATINYADLGQLSLLR